MSGLFGRRGETTIHKTTTAKETVAISTATLTEDQDEVTMIRPTPLDRLDMGLLGMAGVESRIRGTGKMTMDTLVEIGTIPTMMGITTIGTEALTEATNLILLAATKITTGIQEMSTQNTKTEGIEMKDPKTTTILSILMMITAKTARGTAAAEETTTQGITGRDTTIHDTMTNEGTMTRRITEEVMVVVDMLADHTGMSMMTDIRLDMDRERLEGSREATEGVVSAVN